MWMTAGKRKKLLALLQERDETLLDLMGARTHFELVEVGVETRFNRQGPIDEIAKLQKKLRDNSEAFVALL